MAEISDENIKKLLESKNELDVLLGASFLYKKCKESYYAVDDYIRNSDIQMSIDLDIYIGNVNICTAKGTKPSVYGKQVSPSRVKKVVYL